MSHDHGRTPGPADDTSPARSARPSLDRPSLFAGMDPDHPDPGLSEGPASVRLLSTLESAQRPSRGPARRSRPRARRSWLPRLALGLMGAGALALLAVFAVVVSEGNPEAGKQTVSSATTSSSTRPVPAPPSSSSAPASMAAPPASAASHASPTSATSLAMAAIPPAGPLAALAPPAAARIENVQLAGVDGAAARMPAPPTGASAPPSPQGGAATSSTKTAKAATAEKTATQAGSPTARRNTERAPSRPKAGDSQVAQRAQKATPGSTRPAEDDVALVQAVMAHARTRPQAAPAAPAASCTRLGGAEAATCLARHCVRHPKDPACHAD